MRASMVDIQVSGRWD